MFPMTSATQRGRELFYTATSGQMAVEVKLGNALEIGVPHVLFDSPLNVTADGQRFLSIESAGEFPAARINVVLNWTAEMAGK